MQDPFHVGLESQQEAYMRKVSFCLHIRSDPGFQLTSNMITRVDKYYGGGNCMMMDPYSIWWLWNVSYLFGVDVGPIPCGFWASSTMLRLLHENITVILCASATQDFSFWLLKSGWHEDGSISPSAIIPPIHHTSTSIWRLWDTCCDMFEVMDVEWNPFHMGFLKPRL